MTIPTSSEITRLDAGTVKLLVAGAAGGTAFAVIALAALAAAWCLFSRRRRKGLGTVKAARAAAAAAAAAAAPHPVFWPRGDVAVGSPLWRQGPPSQSGALV